MADLVDRTLELIPKYESPEGNVRNKQYDSTHTAQGYWQITDSNWNAYGPKAGIDIKKFPHAMDASREDQKKVARHLLMNTDLGIKNWMAASNPKFLDEWEAASKETGDLPEGFNTEAPKTGQNGQTKSGQITVKKPPGGWFQRFAEEKDPSSTFVPSQGFGLVPGARKLTRAATGYGLPPGATWKTRAAEGIEGLGDVSLPIGVGAATLATGGAAGGALLAGEGLGGAAAAGGGALLPYALGAGGSYAGSQIAESAAKEFTDDPETQRLITDVGGLGGGFLGGFGGPKIFKTPVGRAAVGAFIGHHSGIPYGGELGAILGAGGDYFPGKIGKAIRFMGKGGEEGRPVTVPKTPEMDDAVHFGTIKDEDYIAHQMKLGATRGEAEVKLNTAKARSIQKTAQEAAKAKKEAQQEALAQDAAKRKAASDAAKEADRQAKAAREAQSEAAKQGPTVQATPEMVRSSTNPQGPPSVTLPPGITIKAPPPVQGPPATGTFGPQLNPPPQMPVAPPPQNLGTLNPPPGQPGPPLGGPAATGTPIAPPLGAPTPEPPPAITGTAGPQGTVNAPPGPSNLRQPVPTRTPIGTFESDFTKNSRDIADLATQKGSVPPGPSNVSKRQGWEKILGRKMTNEEWEEGRRIYKDRQNAAKRTANFPGKKPSD